MILSKLCGFYELHVSQLYNQDGNALLVMLLSGLTELADAKHRAVCLVLSSITMWRYWTFLTTWGHNTHYCLPLILLQADPTALWLFAAENFNSAF